jgi:hypothetical protein
MSEFYVGYLPIRPGLRRFVRRVVGALAVIAAGAAIAFVFEQSPFAPSAYEYQDYRDFQGVLLTKPYPALAVPDGPPWLLAGPGKHGFAPPPELSGQVVRLRGERIHRGSDRMIAVRTVTALGQGEVLAEVDLGHAELTGEIVDSKCYLGVMNPGSGKVHRDCAVRCLSGGIPPALLVRDANGAARTVLLGNWRRGWLDRVAEPVTLSGRLARSAGRLILYAE